MLNLRNQKKIKKTGTQNSLKQNKKTHVAQETRPCIVDVTVVVAVDVTDDVWVVVTLDVAVDVTVEVTVLVAVVVCVVNWQLPSKPSV